jgi:hypothetical protein
VPQVNKITENVIAVSANRSTRFLEIICPVEQTVCTVQSLTATMVAQGGEEIPVTATVTRTSIPSGQSAFVDIVTPASIANNLTTSKSGTANIFARVAGAGALTDANRRLGIRRGTTSSTRKNAARKAAKKRAAKAAARG